VQPPAPLSSNQRGAGKDEVNSLYKGTSIVRHGYLDNIIYISGDFVYSCLVGYRFHLVENILNYKPDEALKGKTPAKAAKIDCQIN
jgi:hypothetical protein